MDDLVLGIDGQRTRLGWALIRMEDASVVALGCEKVDRKDGGWLHQQVRFALNLVRGHASENNGRITLVAREDPWLGKFVSTARTHGYVSGVIDAAVVDMFNLGDMFIDPIDASAWKSECGIRRARKADGETSKTPIMEWAVGIVGRPIADQDAADALGVAVSARLRYLESI